MKVLIHANCQGRPLADLIERSGAGVTVIRVPPVHVLTPGHTQRVHDAAKEADFVLSQPISDAHGDFSTTAIKSVARGPVISFHSIHFEGLFPHLSYLRKPEGGTLGGPLLDYHDKRIVRAYAAGKSQAECLSAFDDPHDEACRQGYTGAVHELTKREASIDVKLVDFIKANISKTRLFYTFNHPSNFVLWEVAKQFLAFAGTKPKLSGAPDVYRLDKIIAPIAPEVSGLFGAPGENHYTLDQRRVPTEELISKYYDLYESVADMPALAARNGI